LVRQIGGRPSGTRTLLVGLLALTCAVAVFWRASSLQGLLQVSSLETLKETLSLPSVSWISIDATSSSVARHSREARVLRWCTRAGETVLIAMVVLFLLSVFSDSLVSREMADNPLGTFVHRVASTCGM
jgi:hypothetical protein